MGWAIGVIDVDEISNRGGESRASRPAGSWVSGVLSSAHSGSQRGSFVDGRQRGVLKVPQSCSIAFAPVKSDRVHKRIYMGRFWFYTYDLAAVTLSLDGKKRQKSCLSHFQS